MAETEVKEKLDEVLAHYSGSKDELIPILQEAQEQFGYLPTEVMSEIARFLRMPGSAVFGVSTFYTQFRLTPPGKRVIRVCQGPACHMRGATNILSEVERKLGIKSGETTDDYQNALETTTCSGSCALAPVVEIDNNVYGQITATKVREILAEDEVQ